MKHFDVAVVGRGIAGLCLARELLQTTQKSIALIGPEQAMSGSGTIVAQGISAVRGLVLAKDSLFAAKLAGHHHLRTWLPKISGEAGLEVPFHDGGIGEMATSLSEFQVGMDRAYHRRFLGVFGPIAGNFSGSGLKAFGVLHREDFWFDPQEALRALELVLRLGSSRLVGLSRQVLSVSLQGTEGVRLTLDEGEVITAGQVVLAAGANTPNLLQNNSEFLAAGWRKIEGETFLASKVEAAVPEFIASDAASKGLSQPVASFVRGAFSLSQKQNGDLIAGSTTQKNAAGTAKNPLEAMAYEISMMVGKQAEFDLQWKPRWGVRLRTKDRAPICGVVPRSGNRLWLFSAFYKNGLQLAPLLARNLAQAIATNDESSIPYDLSPSRFGR